MGYTLREGDYGEFGARADRDSVIFTFEGRKEDVCCLLLYGRKPEPRARLLVPADYCTGSVRSVRVLGLSAENLRYNYEINGEVVTDPYARRIIGREKWNDAGRAGRDYLVCGGLWPEGFDWQGDRRPEVPRHRMVMYKLHVRGFSMGQGRLGRLRGTFGAVTEEIPRLKGLGITTLELMPAYEFEEITLSEVKDLPPHHTWESRTEDIIKPEQPAPTGKVNYWGYVPGNYFAVKASYSGDPDASREFKEMVRALHENGMECVMEMHFGGGADQRQVLDVLRFWVREYHVDGFHLLGDPLPVAAAAGDLLLSRTKLFCAGFEPPLLEGEPGYPQLYKYTDEYIYPLRKLLNQMGGNLGDFVCQQRKQHPVQGFVNFAANNNGFTLLDLFSYSEKHNQENGEENRDGNDWNFSANCGVEGGTRKRSVKELRELKMRNALAAVFLGQGVPLLLAGDEAGNSQEGNNNAYCQDNPTGWVGWKRAEQYGWLAAFIGKLCAFRREHPVIALEIPMEGNDYRRKGFPDLSYHGENAWIPFIPQDRMAVGMMYCGAYAVKEDGAEDDFLYVGYNFHTGLGRLALPKLPEEFGWYLVMDTSLGREAFLPVPERTDEPFVSVRGQSVVLLVGKRQEREKPRRRRKGAARAEVLGNALGAEQPEPRQPEDGAGQREDVPLGQEQAGTARAEDAGEAPDAARPEDAGKVPDAVRPEDLENASGTEQRGVKEPEDGAPREDGLERREEPPEAVRAEETRKTPDAARAEDLENFLDAGQPERKEPEDGVGQREDVPSRQEQAGTAEPEGLENFLDVGQPGSSLSDAGAGQREDVPSRQEQAGTARAEDAGEAPGAERPGAGQPDFSRYEMKSR